LPPYLSAPSTSKKKAELPGVTLTLVTLGSPAFLDLRIRDFLSPSYGGFGFDVLFLLCSRSDSERDVNRKMRDGALQQKQS